MKKLVLSSIFSAVGLAAMAEFSFDFGADVRIRQEIYDNVPGLPNGGVLMDSVRGKYNNRIRFRPRVWSEVKAGEKFRLFTRIIDEFRWNVRPKNHATEWPDELLLDNLFIEGKGLFDGFVDLKAGRQDITGYCGLDHIFQDGTPGDGSRTAYADMVSVRLNLEEDRALDIFAMYTADKNILRLGDDDSRRTLTGIGGGSSDDRDEGGWGAVWSAYLNPSIPYNVFAMQKNTSSFYRRGEKNPRTQVNLAGFKVVPRIADEWSLQFEAMGQVGENGDSDTTYGWSTYAALNWEESTERSVRGFGSLAFHFMSGDKNAAEEYGGNGAWDPMWYRGACDSEIFLYGTHYGTAWWSNMYFAKLTAGLDFGHRHKLMAFTGPLFAAASDGMGGGDGSYKGLLSRVKYEFPLIEADKDMGERFEVFGHLICDFFNPGSYYESSKPAWFVRWQIEMKF
jgi:hypothetical protein